MHEFRPSCIHCPENAMVISSDTALDASKSFSKLFDMYVAKS